MGKIILTALLSLAFLTSTAQAQNNLKSFKIVVPQFPTFIGNCDATSAYITKAFKLRTGLEVVSVECVTNGYDNAVTALDYGIIIHYLAAKRLHRVAIGDPASLEMESIGSYASYQECLADLSTQVRIFKKATGLQPVFAYCFENRGFGSSPWTFHGEAYGNPIASPQIFTYPLGTVNMNAEPHFIPTLSQAFEKNGALVANVLVRWNLASEDRALTIRYYSDSPEFPFVWHIKTDSMTRCNALRQISRDLFQASHYETWGDICVPRFDGSVQLDVFSSGAEWDFQEGSLPFVYQSYAICAEDLSRVLSIYQSPDGFTLKGGFCDGSDGYVVIKTLNGRT